MSHVTFDAMKLLPSVRRAVAEEGYEIPTAVQAAAIPHVLAGRDVLGCARTGTGKTAAFALPVLSRLGATPGAASPNAPQALVLAPTRELAAQIGESFSTYGRHLSLKNTVIFGGVGQATQVRVLGRGIHILVATPGRLLDLMKQGHVRLDKLKVFVLDEADRMLDMGFLPDLRRIIAALPKQRQSLFFSATLPPQIVDLAGRLLKEPARIDVTPKTASVELIDQHVVFVAKPRKGELLRTLLHAADVQRAVVFTRTKRGADVVAKRLTEAGVEAAAIHGNKSQNNRQRTLARFRGQGLRVLVATDLAARGIDVEGVTHVVNYEVPDEPESYVHRIGRTGRAGARGVAVTFCDPVTERSGLRAIERLIGRKVPVRGNEPADHEAEVPSESAATRPAVRPPARRPAKANRAAGGAGTGQSQHNRQRASSRHTGQTGAQTPKRPRRRRRSGTEAARKSVST